MNPPRPGPGGTAPVTSDAGVTRRPSRRLWIAGSVGVVAAASGALWSWWRSRAEAAAADAEALWAQRFERPDGGQLVMAELRGRALVLNFWATWCVPCVREMPELDRFARTHADRVNVVGLAIDTRRPVLEFLAQRPVGFAIGLAGDGGVDLARRLGNTAGALPFTVIFDADGRVVRSKLGETSRAEVESWTKGL